MLFIASISLLSLLLFISGCQKPVECPVCKECPICDICKECPEEKALLSTETKGWFVNELNHEQILFHYYVYNFGYVETKNIAIKCKLLDKDDKAIIEVNENIGNLGSASSKFGETVAKKTPQYDSNGYYSPICIVTSCDNCDILEKRIPELQKYFE